MVAAGREGMDLEPHLTFNIAVFMAMAPRLAIVSSSWCDNLNKTVIAVFEDKPSRTISPGHIGIFVKVSL